jgi:hypothetical protein
MKCLCRTAERPSFGVRSLETAFPFPRLLVKAASSRRSPKPSAQEDVMERHRHHLNLERAVERR